LPAGGAETTTYAPIAPVAPNIATNANPIFACFFMRVLLEENPYAMQAYLLMPLQRRSP